MSTSTKSSVPSSALSTPRGVTSRRSGPSLTDTFPSAPAINPKSQRPRQQRTISSAAAVDTKPSAGPPIHDLAPDDRDLGAAGQPGPRERRVAALGEEISWID